MADLIYCACFCISLERINAPEPEMSEKSFFSRKAIEDESELNFSLNEHKPTERKLIRNQHGGGRRIDKSNSTFALIVNFRVKHTNRTEIRRPQENFIKGKA